jgi:hypothetical protein
MSEGGRLSRLLPLIEIAAGVALIAALLLITPSIIVRFWLVIVGRGLAALPEVIRVDGAATSWSLTVCIARFAIAFLPSIVLLRHSPRYRWTWLVPILAIALIMSSPVSLTAGATAWEWVRLVVVSATAAFLCRFRLLGWTAVFPILLLWAIAPGHSLAPARTADPAYRAKLFVECAQHDGTRPRNLTPDRLMPYHGITALGPGLLLLTGEGENDGGMRGYAGDRRVGSWWIRRGDGGELYFAEPSGATGNLWRGCALGRTLWMARANQILGAERLSPGELMPESVHRVQLPSNAMDFSQTGCDPARGRVYASEAYEGGTWEMDPATGAFRRHEIGGGGLWPKFRFDGRMIFTDTASLIVFDPDQERVVERTAAALLSIGSDVCPHDGAVAVPDLLGRVRVFVPGETGRYDFSWAVSVFAPRRVAYSQDCSRLAVTSGDDHRVFMIDTALHRVIATYRAGPALREVVATGPNEISITDTCSMTTYRW